ncbi:hypothetical protein [Microbispora sp. NPDC049125]|uniref:hypothetical protein n=1 Tax=Microbispora sp. NPDC049125 TaxID=3154929 RepID=UPI00346569C8
MPVQNLIIDTTLTSRWLGTCTTCVRPVAIEDNTLRGAATFTPCPECGQRVEVKRLVAVTTEEVCDANCMSAVGPACSCACGGENHGSSWGKRSTTMEFQVNLEKYRAKVAKQNAAKQRREANRREAARAAFQAWADPHENLINYLRGYDGGNGFLEDMARHVNRYEILTDRQVTAAYRAMDWEIERAERDAKRAEQEANAKPVPLGKGIVIEGVVVHADMKETFYGGGRQYVDKMLVLLDDGGKIWCTIPTSLHGVTTVGNLHGLKNVRVRFTADVALSKNDPDPLFGIATRPKQAVRLEG